MGRGQTNLGLDEFPESAGEFHLRLERAARRLALSAATAMKREKWRLEVWYSYHCEIAPLAVQLKERATRLLSLLGDVPEKVPERLRTGYHRAIHQLANTGYGDEELLRFLSVARQAGAVRRHAREIPSEIRDPLFTINAAQQVAKRDARDLARSMPKIEADAKKAREGRNQANQEAAQGASCRKSYYNELAAPIWRKNSRLSKKEVAKIICENHSDQIKRELNLDVAPSANTIRQSLTKPTD